MSNNYTTNTNDVSRETGEKGCLLGLDLGTSAIKGVLTDLRGNILTEADSETSLLHPAQGWIEFNPDQHYREVCGVIRKLAAKSPAKIIALAMAAASGNTLLTDRQGTPLNNVISWMDQRAEEQPPSSLDGLTVNEVRQITGWPCVSTFPLAHLAWLQENREELYRQADHYGMNTDWLLYRLTGRWLMDHSTATTFHLQDQAGGRYHQPFLNRLRIPPEKLSALVPSGTLIGPLTEEGSQDTGLSRGTAIVSGCFDHPAAARAVDILEPGQLMLSCGTSWVGFTPIMERQRIIDAGLLCDPFFAGRNGPWGGIFSVPYIGRNINWYVDNLIAPGEKDKMRIFDQLSAQAEPQGDKLRLDLRRNPHSIEADRASLSRAVMESAARLLGEKLHELKTHGFDFHRAVMVGGPANSPIWPEIVEQITGLKLVIGNRSAGARGAALLAGAGADSTDTQD